MSLVDAFLLDPAAFHVWVCRRTDGNDGNGSISDPYDASTQARFDGVMSLFASLSSVTVHLGPGEFQTNGYNTSGSGVGWQARSGMKIVGSGMDVTTLKLVNVSPGAPAHYFAVGHVLSSLADTFEISDLTIDANTANANTSAACGGVRVMGNHARIRRVKAINCGTRSASVPAYALSIVTANPDAGTDEVVNAAIEDCVVISPYTSNAAPVTALYAGGPNDTAFIKEGHAKCPSIRNCFVDCGVTTPNPDPAIGKYRGIAMRWCRGGVVEGNQIYNTDIGGPYQAQSSVRDLIVRNNFYKNVARAVYLNLGQLGSNLVSSNASVSLSNGVATISGGGLNVASLAAGDRVSIMAVVPSTTTPSLLTGTYQVSTVQSTPSVQFTIRTSFSDPATITTVKKVLSVNRAIIEGNVVEIAGSGAVAMAVSDNNGAGNYLEPPDYPHGDVIVRGNKIRYVDGVPPNDGGATLIQMAGARNAMVKDNVLDTIATAPLVNQRCGNMTYFNNKKPNGALLEGFNPDTVQRYAELESDNDFALVMSMFERRR